MSIKDQLRGTGVALVTPFDKNGDVDYKSLHKLIDFVIEGGVNYLVALGTTGETPTLTKEEKSDIVHFTFEKTASRLPIVVGVGGNNTREVIEELERLPLSNAAAILSASPYYNKPSQEGIFQHYKMMASSTAKPILLYNVPGRTGSNITAETTVRLAREISNINGIKEASGNFNQCLQILRDKPQDFLVVSGDDNLAMAQVACGMDGVISVAANCFPKDFSMMITHALKNEFDQARPLSHRLLKGFDLLFAENNPAGVKAFLAELGIIHNHLRLPLLPLSSSLGSQVRTYLAELN